MNEEEDDFDWSTVELNPPEGRGLEERLEEPPVEKKRKKGSKEQLSLFDEK